MIPRAVKHKKLLDTPGVYLMKGARGKILYIGKAANLKRRVESYFARPQERRIAKLLGEVKKIDFQKTDSALEALILEARLIKKHQPPFNVREKDDKSFLYAQITKERFPRVLLVRGKDLPQYEVEPRTVYGPFTSAKSIREALRIIRKIFPFSIHSNLEATLPSGSVASKSVKRPCFEYEIGLCPGTCVGATTRGAYMKNIRNIKLFFEGKKQKIIKNLQKEMKQAVKKQEFEQAEKLKRQIFSLRHIRDISLITESDQNFQFPISNFQKLFRIEGYDVSNISGTSAVGAMVVFQGDKPNKKEYRKFKIRSIKKADDVGMLKEVLWRRLKHNEWPPPNLILIDGGKAQVNAVKQVLNDYGLKIPVVGIVKGKDRKKNEFVDCIPKGIEKNTLIKIRNEAHRFALSFHKKVRSKQIK